MNPTPSFSPQHCPLCGQPNQCAMEIARSTGVEPGPCWCSRTTFSADLLNKIPEAARGIACLCAACVKASES